MLMNQMMVDGFSTFSASISMKPGPMRKEYLLQMMGKFHGIATISLHVIECQSEVCQGDRNVSLSRPRMLNECAMGLSGVERKYTMGSQGLRKSW